MERGARADAHQTDTRLGPHAHACRCFFELLALQTKGLMRLMAQPAPPQSSPSRKGQGLKGGVPDLDAQLTSAGVLEGVRAGGRRVALSLAEMASSQQQ